MARNMKRQAGQQASNSSRSSDLKKDRESRHPNELLAQSRREGNSDEPGNPEQAHRLSTPARRNHVGNQSEVGNVKNRVTDTLHHAKEEEADIQLSRVGE